MRTLFLKWWKAIFTYPQKTLSLVDEDYDAYWRQKRGTEPSLSDWQKERAQMVIVELKQRHEEDFTIADIGCGDGVLLMYILKSFPKARGIGYDSSSVAHELAKKAGVHETKFLDLRTDVGLVAVAETDYILLLETLEHIPDSEKVLHAASQKARKGVFISFPNSGFFTYRLRLLFGKVPAQWIRMPNEHIRFWTLGDLKWWLTALGYTHFSVTPYQGIPVLKHILPGSCAAGLFAAIRGAGTKPDDGSKEYYE